MSLSVASARHTQALLGSIGRLVRNPFATVLTLLVIGLALALPMALSLFVTNAQAATGGFTNAVDMSVYFKTDVPLAKAQQLAADARQRSGVAEVTVIPADKALEEFRTYSGFGTALEALKENPLPHVLHVRPRPEATSAAALESLRHYFSAWPEVDIVQIDSEWVMRFNAILEVLRRLLVIAAILLGAGVLAVIGNTIRLEILNRRAEIEVTKLVGGSNRFVRRPFLYTGMLYGLGGAVLAWLIVEAAVAILGEPVATLAQLYGSRYTLQGPTGDDIGIVLGAGVVLGWLGAWISAARHLRSIEPRAEAPWRAALPDSDSTSDDGNPAEPAMGQPVVIPYTELSDEALRGLLEAFVLREGTEYGERDVSLEQKVAQVTRQLRRGEAQIVFDPASESVDIVVVRP